MILYSATWKKEGEKDAVLYARVFSLEATSVVIRGRKGGGGKEEPQMNIPPPLLVGEREKDGMKYVRCRLFFSRP